MKKSEVKISVKLCDISDAPLINAWDEMCEKYGVNRWCLNEGLADKNDTVDITLEDAERWGIVEKDDER